jgi:hypothetical protein
MRLGICLSLNNSQSFLCQAAGTCVWTTWSIASIMTKKAETYYYILVVAEVISWGVRMKEVKSNDEYINI